MKHILASLLFASIVFANQAYATVINPTANFTLRSSTNAGPADSIDDTWGGGFDGFLSNLEGSQVDRTFLEYSTAGFGGPVVNATLNFNLSGSATDIISMGWYEANGAAELAEWGTLQTPFTTFNAGAGAYSIDITSLINLSIGGPAFIGFGFSIDSHPNQAFFSMTSAPVINFTTATVPEPSAVVLLCLGLAAAAYSWRRVKA